MPRDTKTALLDAAEHAARTRGYDGFSYADLAHEVGIRKASIHHHFPTKAALSVALISRYYDDLQAACAQIDATHASGGARLLAMIDRYRTALDGGKSLCLCVAFSTGRDSLPPDVTVQMRRLREMMKAWITSAFALGMSDGTVRHVAQPEQEAAATLPLLEGAQLAARSAKNTDFFDQATALLSQRITSHESVLHKI